MARLGIKHQGERGDTLIEVVMATAILAVVIITSYNVANLAFRIGVQAKERTEAIRLAQDQAEKLRAYRDYLARTNPDQATTPKIITGGAGLGNNFPCYNGSSRCYMRWDDGRQTWRPFLCPDPSTPHTRPNTCHEAGNFYDVWMTQTVNADSDRIDSVITVQWPGVLGSEETAQINYTLVDTRGAAPVDCSVAGKPECYR